MKNNKIKKVFNKRALYNYFIEKKIESGMVLYGWEIKSIRSGKININNSYIFINQNEAFLIGSVIDPLSYINNYKSCNSKRNRKLLLNKKEINFLRGYANKSGYTLISISSYWKKSFYKLQIGLAKSKQKKDKREQEKKHEWDLNKRRLMKNKIC
ncbi:SsrA-binding protein SmpB [Buchnera aphidicola (Neophyllaphis podocarpi)]|uniref:SsrA-binding protein SmpB n=1 Tax=Buchnera aphidicola TaxID=9 RepID=UPI0031B88933